jgi:hypothetical protein
MASRSRVSPRPLPGPPLATSWRPEGDAACQHLLHWRLHAGLTTVLYDTAGPGVLHYVHPPMNLVFNGPQIRVVANPDLGTLVSVTLSVSPVAQTTFTVLLPVVLVAWGERQTLRWRGVDSNFWFRNSHHAAYDRPF